jgi:STE24 endopeptidase
VSVTGAVPAGGRIRHRALSVLGLAAAGVAWWLAARALWRSSVPSGLGLPHVDVHGYFGARFLSRSSSFSSFLDIDRLLESLAVVGALALYARRGAGFARESAAGRIGTGILLGSLGFAVAWMAEVPFELAAVAWERGHHISHEGYLAAVLGGFLGLGGVFLLVAVGLAIVMALARALRRLWFLAAAPVLAALTLLYVFLGGYLVGSTHPLRNAAIASEARVLAAREGLAGVRIVVQNVSRQVTYPNAEAAGLGPSRRVVLWNTLLDGRFSRRQVGVVIAHELGHIAHGHLLRGVGWSLLFLLPAGALIALATRRRGGMASPQAVPLALLLYVVVQLACTPLFALVSRHEEAEADWSALRATAEPATARSLFIGLATASLADPDPPGWSYVLFADHPTIAQRIAMTYAWAENPGLARSSWTSRIRRSLKPPSQ